MAIVTQTNFRNTLARLPRLSALPVLLSLGIGASAQVTGRITDQNSGEPLLAATILVRGTSIGDVADFDGKYRITGLSDGPATLLFSYIGYETDSVTFDYVAGEPYEFDRALRPAGFTVDMVTVTAQRSGQNAAINQQVKSDRIVNVVSAERIRELPDENAAESVGRLPGVSVSRSGGEGQRVNIRGLSPKFSSVNIDGVRVPATGQGRQVFQIGGTGGGGAGSINPQVDDRSVDLSMISSESLAGIEVYKSMTPDQDGDAIGGSVNFVSAKAPRSEKYLVNVLGGHNVYHGSYNSAKANVVYSRRLFGEKFGVIATGAFSQIDRSSDGSSVSYSYNGQETVLEGVNLSDNQTLRRRYNASLTLDYDLGQGHEIYLSGMYAQTTVDNTFRGANLRARVSSANVFAGVNESAIDLANVSLSGRHPVGRYNFDWKATYIQSTDQSPIGYSYGFGDPDPYGGKDVPIDDPYGAVETFRWDPAFLGGGQPGGGSINASVDGNFVGQFNAKRDIRFNKLKTSGYLKAGGKVQLKDRTRERSRATFFSGNFGGAYRREYPEAPFVRQNTPGIAPFLENDASLLEFFNGQYPIQLSIDPSRAKQLAEQFSGLQFDVVNPGINDYTANERIYATYLMTSLNVANRVTVVGGLRYEYSDNDYVANELLNYGEFTNNGQVGTSGTIKELTSAQDYGNLLPSVNVKVNLVKNDQNSNGVDLRLAAARALTRPDFYNLTPFIQINNSGFNIQRSDPNLLPTTATNYDAYLTLFSGKLGLLSFGGFYKELDDVDYLYGRRLNTDQVEERFGEQYDLTEAYTIIEPINAPARTFIRGAEIELQTSLTWLPKPFDGLVLYGNYSRINSDAKYPRRYFFFDEETFMTTTLDSTRDGTLPGQARDIVNASVGYDKGKFSGRVSWNYQGKSVAFVGANEFLDNYTGDYLRIDASAKYNVNRTISVQVNVNNINNRTDNSVVGVEAFPGSSTIFGTMAWVGVRFSGFTDKSQR